MSKEAIKLALDELLAEYYMENSSFAKRVNDIFKEVPAQPQQEPVAWMHKIDCDRDDKDEFTAYYKRTPGYCIPLYTSPQTAQQDPVAEVKAKMTGGNACIATVIHEIYNPMRHPLVPGDLLYASPVNQAPVGWMHSRTGLFYSLSVKPDESGLLDEPTDTALPIYTSPPAQRKPLTDDEILAIGKELGLKCRLGGNSNIDFDYARAIEAAHGIKGER